MSQISSSPSQDILHTQLEGSGWESLHISDPSEFDKKIRLINQKLLAIISDFDRTLTSHLVDGEKRPSLISVLRSQRILGEEYSQAAYALSNYFHPIETDLNRTIEDRSAQMDIWWKAHGELLSGGMSYAQLEQITGVLLPCFGSKTDHIKVELRRGDIDRVTNSGIIQLRRGIATFFDRLEESSIPLVIFSASGLGGDSIRSYLANHQQLRPNTHIISNSFVWNDMGVATARKEPVIHTFNKEISAIQAQKETYHLIQDKTSIILLGDSIGDAHMADGHPSDVVLRIGFLTENPDANLAEYMRKFDIVLVGDGDMHIVNKIIGLLK